MTDVELPLYGQCSIQCKAKKFLKTPDKVLPLLPLSDFYRNHGINAAKKGSQARAERVRKLFSTKIFFALAGKDYHGNGGQDQPRPLSCKSLSQHFPVGQYNGGSSNHFG